MIDTTPLRGSNQGPSTGFRMLPALVTGSLMLLFLVAILYVLVASF